MNWGMWFEAHWPVYFGYIAVISSVVTCSMKTMVPLRVVSMLCNTCFIVYGYFGAVYPTLILNCILLPLNAVRLYQMFQLVYRVEDASKGDPSLDFLKPFMSKRHYRKGDILFHKGDVADTMF